MMSPDAMACMLQSRELFRAAHELTAGDSTPKLACVAALIGALAVAIAETDTPIDALNAAVVSLNSTREVMPALRAAAITAASTRGTPS